MPGLMFAVSMLGKEVPSIEVVSNRKSRRSSATIHGPGRSLRIADLLLTACVEGTDPDVNLEVLRSNMTLPFVPRVESRRAAGKCEKTY